MLNKNAKIDDADIPKIGKDILKYYAVDEMKKNLFEIDPNIMKYCISEKFINEKKKYLKSNNLFNLI